MDKIIRYALLIIGFLSFYTEGSFAQVAINTDGSAPDANAILDLKSTNKGFLPPRMTNAQIKAIPSPTEGMLAYDTELKCLRMYTGTEWQCQQPTNKELSDPPGDFSILATATGSIIPHSTTVDFAGNIYVTGNFTSATATFGSTVLTNTGGGDVFVVKYNSSGVVQWAVKGGGAYYDFGTGIAVDVSGNVYITGSFNSPTATFGSIVLTNTGINTIDVFVVKYNTSGAVQWAVNGGSASDDFGTGIAVDVSGNVYITGSFSSPTATFGTIVLTNSGSSDFFVVKYNTNGVVQWAVNGGSASENFVAGIAVDGSDNAYITGYFTSTTATFGTTVLTNTSTVGHSDVFVVKYNTSGVVQWAVKGGGDYSENGYGIAVDGSGNAYITGSFSSLTATFGTIVLTNTSTVANLEVFIVKYNTSGVVQWAVKGGGHDDNDYGTGIAVDGSGNAYITGFFYSGTVSFGSTVLKNTGYYDVFVVKCNSSGVVQWAVKGGGAYEDKGTGIATNAAGTRVYTAVQYSPNAKFGNTILKTGSGFIWLYGE